MISSTLVSQETQTKTIEKTFKMTNAGELHLDNKHGNITITGWAENKVLITIDVSVTDKKKENAKALLDRIVPEIKSTGDFVSITTLIKEKSSSVFSNYFNKVNPFEFDKSNLDINYTVYLPVNAEIDVTNKFGDVFTDNWTGKLKANVEHGDLWINDAIANARIDMKFGKLRGNSIGYGVISLKNGDIDIKQSENLLLNTSGANIELEAIKDLELTSSKDEAVIGLVESLHGELKYSNIQIDSIGNKADLKMRVAEFRVDKIVSKDAEINITQESSDIHINIKDTSFNLKANLEQGVLRLPKSFSSLQNNVIDKGKRIREITGTYGTEGLGSITFIGEKGVIVLDE
ncbi:hypothetical protein [Algibacter mikhailovii]|uniref:Adhesin domain-containing protein n=1 Tax=Algibacter mikhailovii TaxID=425498 RepID=A0A918QWI0_9FLAO|nr:hypothetical protein [Algibacter mikhailovii]GGZ70180.1 hypothetical protein GCM10007028_04110 [Algibacter mikhailovii]